MEVQKHRSNKEVQRHRRAWEIRYEDLTVAAPSSSGEGGDGSDQEGAEQHLLRADNK